MTIRELRAICQPAFKAKIDPLMEHRMLRPFSIYFTWLFVKLGLQANHATFVGFAFAAVGSGMLLVGDRYFALGGAVCIWMAFLFDCVDGEVARYRKGSSVSGIYLDYITGMFNDGMIFVALGFYVSAVSGWDARWFVIPSAMLVLAEKLVGLTAHTVVFRNCRTYWNDAQADAAEDTDAKVWKEMGLFDRLLRVPFETFFRVTFLLVAVAASIMANMDAIVVAAWGIIAALSAIVSAISFRNEFFRNRVEGTMYDFIKALKTREETSAKRAA